MLSELVAKFDRLARQGYWKLRGLLSRVLSRDSILVLHKEIDVSNSDVRLRIKEYASDPGEIIAVYKSVGRYNCYPGSDDDRRMAARIRKGMKFYVALHDDVVIAYLWLHAASHRFFDEIGVFVRHGTDDLWLRDVYVVPHMRGQRIFGSVINAVVREYYPASRNLYSDVMAGNAASQRAHRNLGLSVIGCVRFVRILGRILYRKVDVKGLEIYGHKLPRNLLLMDEEYRSFVRDNSC